MFFLTYEFHREFRDHLSIQFKLTLWPPVVEEETEALINTGT